MAFWAFDDQFNYPAAAGHDHGDEGWGFDAPEGGNQDWWVKYAVFSSHTLF